MEEKGLYRKILNVMEKVQHLEKDGKIAYGSTKYKYVTEEKVTTTVRQAMIEEGLIILPITVTAQTNNNLTVAHCEYMIIDVDTGQQTNLQSIGQGSDSQDKGSNKALTGAYKYLLLRTFAIPTGDDPDKTSSGELDDEGKERKRKAIMEFLDHENFTGTIEWKGTDRNLDTYKEAMKAEMNNLSMQRLTTLLKHAGEMFELATHKELEDIDLHKEVNDLRKDI
jgi:hypothetical protein